MRSFVFALALALALAAVAPVAAYAQLADTKVLTLAAVKNAIAAAESEAKANGWNVSIAVTDANGDLLGFHRMDGASILSIQISQAKAQTSAKTKRASKDYQDRVTAGTLVTLAMPLLPLEGAVPITVNGVHVGAIGVSGATSAQDAQCAMKGAAAVTP